MKKLLIAIVLFSVILSISGCKESEKKEDDDTITKIEEKEKGEILSDEKEEPKNVVPRDNCDFRNAKWGDTKEDIILYEPDLEIIDQTENNIAAYGTVSGYKSYILYSIDKNTNSLYMGGYLFDLKYSNAGQYIPVYETLKNNLIEIYGTPTKDAIVPLAKQDLIDLAGEANALEYGYVQYSATWETDTTNILLGMSAENFDVSLLIQYLDKNYKDTSSSGL